MQLPINNVESWDIVVVGGSEYPNVSVGRVLVAGEATHRIELLEEEGNGEYVATGEELEVSAVDILSIIKEYEYSQRQVDRAHNPHGEHAEEVFTGIIIPEYAYADMERKRH